MGVCGSILRDSKANLGLGERRSCAGEEGWGEKLGVGRGWVGIGEKRGVGDGLSRGVGVGLNRGGGEGANWGGGEGARRGGGWGDLVTSNG